MRRHYRVVSYAIVGVTIFLSACGDKQDAAVPMAAAVDQLAPRYESTLAAGIDFKRPGYPNFLVDVAGVSGPEKWGRWTDGPEVRLRFSSPLPKKFVLELQANAFGPNEGKPVKIRAGTVERVVIIKNVPANSVYTAEFDDVISADTIVITPPSPVLPREVDPSNQDERRLGLGLVSFKIRTSN